MWIFEIAGSLQQNSHPKGIIFHVSLKSTPSRILKTKKASNHDIHFDTLIFQNSKSTYILNWIALKWAWRTENKVGIVRAMAPSDDLKHVTTLLRCLCFLSLFWYKKSPIPEISATKLQYSPLRHLGISNISKNFQFPISIFQFQISNF